MLDGGKYREKSGERGVKWCGMEDRTRMNVKERMLWEGSIWTKTYGDACPCHLALCEKEHSRQSRVSTNSLFQGKNEQTF